MRPTTALSARPGDLRGGDSTGGGARHRDVRQHSLCGAGACHARRGGAAVADTDERERIRLPEPVAAAQTQKDLLLVALTYPTAQQGRDRFRAALPELIQFYRQHTQLKMDVTSAEFSAADRQLKSLVANPLVLGDAGARWRKIPKDHPLYHCYFEFPDGPPLTGAPGRDIVDLEMLEVHGRVAVIFSDLNLTWSWANQEVRYGPNSLRLGPT
jgi:hypothetical protein